MKFYIVDCFAEAKYQGNELLVIVADRAVSDTEQQQIAREINFSETAFIMSGMRENGGYDVLIWTPSVGEVPFAGHPTLGAAYIIHRFLEGGRSAEVRLNLKAGQIPVRVTAGGLVMSQNQPEFGATIASGEIARMFGLDARQISDRSPIQWVSTGLATVIVPLADRESLSRMSVDRINRAAFGDYVLRRPANNCNHLFFVREPDGSIAARCIMEDFAEDPATGSANGCLAAYLLAHDPSGSRDIAYTVRQGEDMGRPSVLRIRAARDGGALGSVASGNAADGDKRGDAVDGVGDGMSSCGGKWTIEVGGSCHLVASGDWE